MIVGRYRLGVNPPRTGRPRVESPRSESMTVPMTAEEKKLVQEAAAKVERTPTDYARKAALDQARRDLDA